MIKVDLIEEIKKEMEKLIKENPEEADDIVLDYIGVENIYTLFWDNLVNLDEKELKLLLKDIKLARKSKKE